MSCIELLVLDMNSYITGQYLIWVMIMIIIAEALCYISFHQSYTEPYTAVQGMSDALRLFCLGPPWTCIPSWATVGNNFTTRWQWLVREKWMKVVYRLQSLAWELENVACSLDQNPTKYGRRCP